MAREPGKTEGIGRREFIAGAALTGAVATLAVCAPSVGEATQEYACRALLHNPAKCVGCGVCGMMCSLYREGEVGPAVSRSAVARDPFTYDFRFDVCRQCPSPRCYFACPRKDTARVIDGVTGLVHVNEDECIGCGLCVTACRYDPPRTKLHPERRVALSCDRCMDRAEGPICVQYCNMNALTCASGERARIPTGRYGRR